MMHQIGLTPNRDMSVAQTIGIQQLYILIFAVFAMRKQGERIKATTQGRMPMKNFSTYMLSLKDWKIRAIRRIITMLGIATPNAPVIPPSTPLYLNPMCDAMSMANRPGVDCATTRMSTNSS